jgi:hypothetical protein
MKPQKMWAVIRNERIDGVGYVLEPILKYTQYHNKHHRKWGKYRCIEIMVTEVEE